MFFFHLAGDDAYSPNGTNSIILTSALNNSSTNTSLSSSNVPSSQSVQQLCLQQQSSQLAQQLGNNGGNGGNSLVAHSQSAYEIGQVPLTPLAQHQQALHQQLQQRFANANINTGEYTRPELSQSFYYPSGRNDKLRQLKYTQTHDSCSRGWGNGWNKLYVNESCLKSKESNNKNHKWL